MQEVEWPSITICNVNQVEASSLKDVNAYDVATGNVNKQLSDLLIHEYILGHNKDISQDHKNLINSINDIVKTKDLIGFKHWSRQSCENLVISMSFRGIDKTWKTKTNFLWKLGWPTDYGECCLLTPHLDFYDTDWNASVTEIYHGVNADTLNGEQNGLSLLLDAEQFNYAYHEANEAGFKISLHHHLVI